MEINDSEADSQEEVREEGLEGGSQAVLFNRMATSHRWLFN